MTEASAVAAVAAAAAAAFSAAALAALGVVVAGRAAAAGDSSSSSESSVFLLRGSSCCCSSSSSEVGQRVRRAVACREAAAAFVFLVSVVVLLLLPAPRSQSGDDGGEVGGDGSLPESEAQGREPPRDRLSGYVLLPLLPLSSSTLHRSASLSVWPPQRPRAPALVVFCCVFGDRIASACRWCDEGVCASLGRGVFLLFRPGGEGQGAAAGGSSCGRRAEPETAEAEAAGVFGERPSVPCSSSFSSTSLVHSPSLLLSLQLLPPPLRSKPHLPGRRPVVPPYLCAREAVEGRETSPGRSPRPRPRGGAGFVSRRQRGLPAEVGEQRLGRGADAREAGRGSVLKKRKRRLEVLEHGKRRARRRCRAVAAAVVSSEGREGAFRCYCCCSSRLCPLTRRDTRWEGRLLLCCCCSAAAVAAAAAAVAVFCSSRKKKRKRNRRGRRRRRCRAAVSRCRCRRCCIRHAGQGSSPALRCLLFLYRRMRSFDAESLEFRSERAAAWSSRSSCRRRRIRSSSSSTAAPVFSTTMLLAFPLF